MEWISTFIRLPEAKLESDPKYIDGEIGLDSGWVLAFFSKNFISSAKYIPLRGLWKMPNGEWAEKTPIAWCSLPKESEVSFSTDDNNSK